MTNDSREKAAFALMFSANTNYQLAAKQIAETIGNVTEEDIELAFEHTNELLRILIDTYQNYIRVEFSKETGKQGVTNPRSVFVVSCNGRFETVLPMKTVLKMNLLNEVMLMVNRKYVTFGGNLVLTFEPVDHLGSMYTKVINDQMYTMVHLYGLFTKETDLDYCLRFRLLWNGIHDGVTQETGWTIGDRVSFQLDSWNGDILNRPPTGTGYEILSNGLVSGVVFDSIAPNSLYKAISFDRPVKLPLAPPVFASPNLVNSVTYGLLNVYKPTSPLNIRYNT